MDDDEMLYREMNQEDGFYMGDRGSAESRHRRYRDSTPSTDKKDLRSRHSASKGTCQPTRPTNVPPEEDANSRQMKKGCVYVALCLFLLSIGYWAWNEYCLEDYFHRLPSTPQAGDTTSTPPPMQNNRQDQLPWGGATDTAPKSDTGTPASGTNDQVSEAQRSISSPPQQPNATEAHLPQGYKEGYEDGYEDGCNRNRGASYSPKQKAAEYLRQYKDGYSEGYYDGYQDTVQDYAVDHEDDDEDDEYDE